VVEREISQPICRWALTVSTLAQSADAGEGLDGTLRLFKLRNEVEEPVFQVLRRGRPLRHLNDAGYRAMGESIDLGPFQ